MQEEYKMFFFQFTRWKQSLNAQMELRKRQLCKTDCELLASGLNTFSYNHLLIP